ncbi:hypothetical protein [Spongiactinospora sp. TRM90649]|uniref:RraA family protein n=1 Tax=Spongiactinospora sp. TRM90649 TaxID=3031114 RepID=UPI0032119C30
MAGLIIDGGVRDTARLRELGFPAFSTHIAIRGTGKRWRGTVGAPLVLRGRPARTGDLVVADEGTPARVETFADALSARLHADGLTPHQLIEAQHALEPAAAEPAANVRFANICR